MMTHDIGSYSVLVLDGMRGRVIALSGKIKVWWPLMAWYNLGFKVRLIMP